MSLLPLVPVITLTTLSCSSVASSSTLSSKPSSSLSCVYGRKLDRSAGFTSGEGGFEIGDSSGPTTRSSSSRAGGGT